MEILTPFEEATDFAQVDNYPSSGYVLPCIQGLEHQLSKLVTRYHFSFILALKESLTKRMAIFEEKNDYILAAVLDLRLKMLWCRDDLEKKAVETVLITEMAKGNQQL
uniref:Uncharacterized protein n=1 Tax=Amphimedon queenslandica TaxID=400682 RepID=A0A1X7UZR8_AMPQE